LTVVDYYKIKKIYEIGTYKAGSVTMLIKKNVNDYNIVSVDISNKINILHLSSIYEKAYCPILSENNNIQNIHNG